MTTQAFNKLLREHNVNNPFEHGFRPRLGVCYLLYQIEKEVDDYILWRKAGLYVRTAWLPNVWLPADCIQAVLDGVVETLHIPSRDKKKWQLVEREVVWYEPVWLNLTPATEQELLRYTRGSWQRESIVDNHIYYNQPSGSASLHTSNYRRSMQNLVKRIKAAGYTVIPVYGPRGGGPNEYLVYQSETER